MQAAANQSIRGDCATATSHIPAQVRSSPGTVTGTRPSRSESRPARGRLTIAPAPETRKNRPTLPSPRSAPCSGRKAEDATNENVTERKISIGKMARRGISPEPSSERALLTGSRIGWTTSNVTSEVPAATRKTASKPHSAAIVTPRAGVTICAKPVAIPK